MAYVKCCDFGKNGHFARDCGYRLRYIFSLKIMNYVCVSMYLSLSLLVNGFVSTGVTKHTVQEKVGFMEFHRYSMGSQTIILGNNSEKYLLGVATY